MGSIDLKACDGACHKCIKRYISKHKLRKGDKFAVPCAGIPKEYIPDGVATALGQDVKAVQAVYDPVTWAGMHLDWWCIDPEGEHWKRKTLDFTLPTGVTEWKPEPAAAGKSVFHRPYQAEMLRCTSKRKVFRLGRQCLTENSYIQLLDGNYKSIKYIQTGDKILSLNINSNKIEIDRVVDCWVSGRKPVYKITTKFGHTITCSKDHPFYSAIGNCDSKNGRTIDKLPKKWLSISAGLHIGNKIAVVIEEPVFGNKLLPEGIPELLGYFISDGSSSLNQSSKFTNTNEQYLAEFAQISKRLGTETKAYPKGNGFDLIISNGRGQDNPVRELLKRFDLINVTGPNKRVPLQIFKAPQEQIRLFLNRLWAGDGYVSTFQRTGRTTFRTEIGMLQENKLLLEDIQRLMWRFGVHGYIKPDGSHWRYVVSNKISVLKFLNNIGPIYGKEVACSVASQNIDNITDKYCKFEGNILWDYITSIEYQGEQDTYDIEVETNHNFISNGIYTHNSGKTETLCIAILHALFTNKDFKVVVIAPYQSQIDLIFTRLENLIKSNNDLANSIKRNVKAPNYQIMLHNKSKVTGFTAGTRSGGNADSVRGQTANMLVFDEADYLSSSDVDSALNTIANFKDATVWMSSTPTGKREQFYKTCHSKLFREFHYPSQVNPNWSEELDQLFKEKLTEDGYKHEVLAQFGEQEEGVYQAKYVEAAQADFSYGQLKYRSDWIYMIGVDWNDPKIGTSIAIVGWCPTDNFFYVVDKETISRGDRTQLAACEKIAYLNRMWHPQAIYVDRGYGTTQIEILHNYGHDCIKSYGVQHPDSQLFHRVKGYDFGGSIETHDLITKLPIKKHAKPFLVENSVRRFETAAIKYPREDKNYTAQLLGYIIDRVTDTGRFVYKPSEEVGDHFLDAVNLALVGFTLEKTPFGKPNYINDIRFVKNFSLGDVKPAQVEPYKLKAEEHKPKEGRGDISSRAKNLEFMDTPSIPGAKLNAESEIKIWRWPGFGHDAPPPKPRTREEAFRQAAQRKGLTPMRRSKRPKRTKF